MAAFPRRRSLVLRSDSQQWLASYLFKRNRKAIF
jgi:hypothetical protein